MKLTWLVLPLLLCSMSFAQNQDMVSIPRDKLTEQQRAELKMNNAQSWVGMGKEIGEAVNSSMAAISTQSNNFAQTPVGKLTAMIVIWKVIGDQAIHVFGGLLELLIFVPIWIWSYRRTCITRRIKTGKGVWETVKYERGSGEVTPRVAHFAVAIGIVATFAITLFAY